MEAVPVGQILNACGGKMLSCAGPVPMKTWTPYFQLTIVDFQAANGHFQPPNVDFQETNGHFRPPNADFQVPIFDFQLPDGFLCLFSSSFHFLRFLVSSFFLFLSSTFLYCQLAFSLSPNVKC
jgi:hypothetical protein